MALLLVLLAAFLASASVDAQRCCDESGECCEDPNPAAQCCHDLCYLGPCECCDDGCYVSGSDCCVGSAAGGACPHPEKCCVSTSGDWNCCDPDEVCCPQLGGCCPPDSSCGSSGCEQQQQQHHQQQQQQQQRDARGFPAGKSGKTIRVGRLRQENGKFPFV